MQCEAVAVPEASGREKFEMYPQAVSALPVGRTAFATEGLAAGYDVEMSEFFGGNLATALTQDGSPSPAVECQREDPLQDILDRLLHGAMAAPVDELVSGPGSIGGVGYFAGPWF